MFDNTDVDSFKKVKRSIMDYERVCGKTQPMFIVGNKSELSERKILPKNIQNFVQSLSATRNIKYCDISCKTGYNIYKPFEFLHRYLTENDSNESGLKNINENIDEELSSLLDELDNLNVVQNEQNFQNEQNDFSNITSEIHHNHFDFSK